MNRVGISDTWHDYGRLGVKTLDSLPVSPLYSFQRLRASIEFSLTISGALLADKRVYTPKKAMTP